MTLRRLFAILPAFFGLTVLGACEPVPTGPLSVQREWAPRAPQVQAAFSDEGAVWSDGQQACVARVPQLRPVCPPWPAATGAVAWNGSRAWVALPSLGQAVTVDGAAESLPAGRVTAMSATRLYREDGSALTYSGEPATGTLGQPAQVLTGGDGRDYALLAGRLWAVDSGHSEAAAGHFLLAVPAGARAVQVPTLSAAQGNLELRGTQVFRTGDDTPLRIPGPVRAFGMIGGKPYTLVGNTGKWQLIQIGP